MAGKDFSKRQALVIALVCFVVVSLGMGLARRFWLAGGEEFLRKAADVTMAKDEWHSARRKLDAELKAAQEEKETTRVEKEELAKALANARADLAKTIADKSAAFARLQKTVEERDDEINELKKEVNRLQDRIQEDTKRRRIK
jgi:hypothetical protein